MSVGDGEVRRIGRAGHVGAAHRVDCDAIGLVKAAATQVGRVDERAARTERRHKPVFIAFIGGLEGAREGKIGRERLSGYVGVVPRIDGNTAGLVKPAAAHIRGVEKRGTVGTQFGHEPVALPTVSGLERSCRSREVAGKRLAGDEGAAGGIDGDSEGLVGVAAPQVS